MVRRRGIGRRASSNKRQPAKPVSDESDSTETSDDITPNGTQKTSKSTTEESDTILSTSALKGLVSEKSLFVKVVDIQKNNTKLMSNINIDISSIKVNKEPQSRRENVNSEPTPNNVNVRSNVNIRNRSVGVVSRVITRSRKISSENNQIVDEVTSVDIVKTVQRSNRNIKLKQLNSADKDPPKSKFPSTNNSQKSPSNDNSLNRPEEYDPCLSGDIMFEQVIDETTDDSSNTTFGNVLEDGRNSKSACTSKESYASPDQDIYSKPSSTSDDLKKLNSNESEVNNVSYNDNDDSKVTSSCSVNECTSSVNDVQDYEVSTKSAFQSDFINASVTESRNIEALSSLKLDPGVEPVSSSKSESCFDPIFSVDTSNELMEVDSADNANDQSSQVSDISAASVNDSVANVGAKNLVGVQEVVVTRGKMLTRSRSGVNAFSSKINKVSSTSSSRNKGRNKTKNMEKDEGTVHENINDENTSENVVPPLVEVNVSREVLTETKKKGIEASPSVHITSPTVIHKCNSGETQNYLEKQFPVKNDYNLVENSKNSSYKLTDSQGNLTASLEEKTIPNEESSLKENNVLELKEKQISEYEKQLPVKATSDSPNLDEPEQVVRRSRRNSADKFKKGLNPVVSSSPREKKSNVSVKALASSVGSEFNENSDKISSLQDFQNPIQKVEKVIPSKSPRTKGPDKSKKDFVTMSSILNEKSKPMSPKELIKKSFIANECRTMEIDFTAPDSNFFTPLATNIDNDAEQLKPLDMILDENCKELNATQKNEVIINKEKDDLKPDSMPFNSSLEGFNLEKPVKVKSRWRRTSELEMCKMVRSETLEADYSRLSSGDDSKSEFEAKPAVSMEEVKLSDEAVVIQRMNSFAHIDSNEYLTERQISKENKRMVCDCTLSKEELLKEEKGCGEDCLNRLLLIECGSRCPLGKLCSNKSFMNRDYTKCRVVNMGNKGVGVLSSENIPSDHFIMEYVGQVLDPKEFRRRAKEYSKDNIAHFYFMSLKADTVIDATHKGNISRFINHSCDPNAETQKWTVNGELRIGFFSKRPISIGEEITFDYQLERYGKEAQKCLCGSANCRGWIGENPENDETDDSEDSDESSDEEMEEVTKESDKEKTDLLDKKPDVIKVKKEKKKLPLRRKEINDTTFNPDGDLEDEIDKLTQSGVKNQMHTLTLSRLIVRAGEESSRTRLLELTRTAATPCLRLFLDYHGLNLLWNWMVDPKSTTKIKSLILETLCILPIQNKTILKDSKVLTVIEKWASVNEKTTVERSSTEEENSSSPQEESNGCKFEDKSDDFNKSNNNLCDSILDDSKIDEPITSNPEITNQASKLLDEWANLKEEFRIPRKQRVEQMKEHERQADMEYSDPRDNLSYNKRRFRDRKESRFDKAPRESRFDQKKEEWNQWQNQMVKMSKAERRQLFAERVKREEREKREAEELWKSHQEQCKALGVNPSQTAMFHPHLNALAFYHKETNCWMPYQEGAESYGGGDGGVVLEHHQPPPHFQLEYPGQLPPGAGYFQQGYQPVFNQFNQSLLFQPPPPPPPQQYSIPPLPHQGPPPHFQPPLPPGQPLLQQGYDPSRPLIQPGPPLPLPPPHHLAPLPPRLGPPVPPLPLVPPHGAPPHQNFHHQPSPLQGLPPSPIRQPLLPLPSSIPQTSPIRSPCVPPLPGNHISPRGSHQQISPSIPQGHLLTQVPVQQHSVLPIESHDSMEVQSYSTEKIQISSAPLKLPPKWKTAKDKEGRLYYYHVKKRVSQWIFPYAAAAAAFNSEPTSESSSEDSSVTSSEEEEDEEEDEEDDSSDQELENNGLTGIDTEDVDDGEPSSAKKRKAKKDEVDIVVQTKKPKESSLVSTILIPRDEAAEIVGITKKKIRDNKEKVKREKARAARKQRQAALQASGLDYASISASVSSKCEADTSSGSKKKIKDIFMLKMANVVVTSLNQYRKHDCQIGRITSTKDFKALAKKLTHFIMVKELRHCVKIEDLDCNDNVKHKARDFIRKYMSKFGPVYVNTKED